jgi:hypothetical protein
MAQLSTAPAMAQGRLDARYEARLAGIPIGKGSWVVDIADDQYSATASGATAGLLQAFAGGQGSGGSKGHVSNGQLIPSGYVATITMNKKTEVIRITLNSGNVKETSIEPEPPVIPDRIPLTDAHRKGVLDPMTASMIKAAGTGDPVSPETCQSTTPIFDGRIRYDLHFAFKRIETAKGNTGYQGPLLVCSVTFTPLAGYVPDRYAIKYLQAQHNMEVWFAPIAGTRMLAMYKVVVPTPLGTGTVEATQFLTSAQVRPNPALAKTN